MKNLDIIILTLIVVFCFITFFISTFRAFESVGKIDEAYAKISELESKRDQMSSELKGEFDEKIKALKAKGEELKQKISSYEEEGEDKISEFFKESSVFISFVSLSLFTLFTKK